MKFKCRSPPSQTKYKISETNIEKQIEFSYAWQRWKASGAQDVGSTGCASQFCTFSKGPEGSESGDMGSARSPCAFCTAQHFVPVWPGYIPIPTHTLIHMWAAPTQFHFMRAATFLLFMFDRFSCWYVKHADSQWLQLLCCCCCCCHCCGTPIDGAGPHPQPRAEPSQSFIQTSPAPYDQHLARCRKKHNESR